MRTFQFCLFVAAALSVTKAQAFEFPRVDADLKSYDAHVAKLRSEFAAIPAAPNNKEWVKQDLAHMVEVDQYMRKFAMQTPFEQKYSAAESTAFQRNFGPRWIQDPELQREVLMCR